MNVRDTSLIAFDKIREHLGPDEQIVFEMLLKIGPTHDRQILEALNKQERITRKSKEQKRVWEINSVTGRRNGLVNIGVVEDLGPHAGRWYGQHKTYHIWRAVGDKREPMGWTPVRQPLPKSRGKPTEFKQAGQRKTTEPTKQFLLFA